MAVLSDDFGCELPPANGVTPVMYYDAAGRLVRREMPDGTLSRVEFSPWHVKSFDANDTVLESQWYQDRGAPPPTLPLAANASSEKRAAWLAAQHADTPAQTILDTLGREVIAVAHNRVKDTQRSMAGRKAPHFYEARRRGQAAVDSRCARQSGDAIHHTGQGEQRPE
ncbi:MAG: hypothetical protein WKF84_19100 [Pyrinomonadaceae bacterium]